MGKVLLISVKPEFASKILSGEKRIELRKSAPKVSKGDTVIIYSTQPEKAFLGDCVVQEIVKHTPGKLWKQYSSLLGIDKKRYEAYFSNAESAIGIVFSSARRYDTKISLQSMRKAFPGFSPPQTFKYLQEEMEKWMVTKSH